MRLARVPFLMCALVVVACDNPPSNMYAGLGEMCATQGQVCSTPACSQFPTTPGCLFVAPTSGFCPLAEPHCWDPTTSKDYCPVGQAVCGKPRSACPPDFCTKADVMSCADDVMDLTSGPFCPAPTTCFKFTCGGSDMTLPQG